MRSVTSASNIHRRAACQGSEKLEAGLPEETSVQAEEGRLLHQYYSNPKLDRSFLKPHQQELLRIAGNNDEQVFERVTQQFNILSSESFEESYEGALWFHHSEDGPLFPGHFDRMRIYPRINFGIIIDQKFGRLTVEPAEANLQLRAYAAMANQERGCTEVAVAISQPRLSYEQRLTLAAYNKADIDASIEQLERIWFDAKNPQAPLRASDSACRYCRARSVCPEFARVMAEGLALIPSVSGTVAKREAEITRTLAEATDEAIGQILNAIQFAGFIDDATKDEARRRIQDDPDASKRIGWKLGKESSKRKIVDPARAIAKLMLRGVLTRDEIFECSAPSLTKLQDKLIEKKKIGYKEAKELVNEILGDAIENEPKSQSLLRLCN